MPRYGREDLLNHNTAAIENACAFGEDREARKARLLRGEQAPKTSEELKREAVLPAGHYSLVGTGVYAQ